MASMNQLVVAVGAILALMVMFEVAPMIGEEINGAWTPGTASQYNSSVNSDLVTGAAFWTSMGSIVKIGAMVVIIATAVLGAIMKFSRA